jgi:hypothetical protein
MLIDFPPWKSAKKDERQYWAEQQGRLPAPPVLPREAESGSGPVRTLSHRLTDEEWQAVRSLAAREEAIVEAVLLACWQALLCGNRRADKRAGFSIAAVTESSGRASKEIGAQSV